MRSWQHVRKEGVPAGPCERWLSLQIGFRSESGKQFGSDLMTGAPGVSKDSGVPVEVQGVRPPITWAAVRCENSAPHAAIRGGRRKERIRRIACRCEVFPQWFSSEVVPRDVCGKAGEYAFPKPMDFAKDKWLSWECARNTPAF